MPHFQNLIFDLDGLMVDTEPLHRRAFNLILSACEIDYQFEAEEYGSIFTGRPVFENGEYLRERFALPQTWEEIGAAHRAIFNLLIADAENIQAMPGLTPLLDFLALKQTRTAIASSSRPEQIELVLRGLNLKHQFIARVGNDGSFKPKPAPDVYLHALTALDARPSQTIALEDSASGVRAAQAAGLYVIAVPNESTRHQDLTFADHTLNDLHAVQSFLASDSN